MKISELFSLLIAISFLHGCNSHESPIFSNCPPIAIDYDAPYSNPIWHPSGEFIGFNYLPLISKDISNGKKKCPHYTYDYTQQGFYLVNADGSNLRCILPYTLLTPAWNPDGNWITYSEGGQIITMPFDGEHFLESDKQQLTFAGSNFYPAWSPDGSLIAYDNSTCGSATEPRPTDGCGILVMNSDGTNKKFIASNSRQPFWGSSNQFIFSYGLRYDHENEFEPLRIFDPEHFNLELIQQISFDPTFTSLTIIAMHPDGLGLRLFSYQIESNKIKTLMMAVQSFAWAPDGRLLVLRYDGRNIDETNGTLWLMEANGYNPQPLLLNEFQLIE